MTTHAAAERAPKQDRSRATRRRLLEAAVECLAEHGWAGSTVAAVSLRAGVSRGAAQHHFPTREDLFTAAVEYVAEERIAAVRAAGGGPPPRAGPPPPPARGGRGRRGHRIDKT
ncbi:TetR family transcriptional regulator, partial [Streptomyces sp. NPDC059506]|uniref:TetR family transcriptional regulator n=1 Tax=Streptomyces sp. NPDC059506 TaxID=3347751 RepID=UPI0036C95A4F